MSRLNTALRVLHLASFVGNIGDLANHAGARRMLSTWVDFPMEFTELEIREFYWKNRNFDDAFVEYANTFDLLLIGGGNYFELWVDESATGTSINITPERLAQLRIPTVFFALGVDTGQGYSQQSALRFRQFMNTVLERSDMFVCVRNDGSSLALHEILGPSDAARIPVMPDGGFFAESLDCTPSTIRSGRIGINIAGDMLERRFDREMTPSDFLGEIASTCCDILDAHQDLSIQLLPHIWRDISLIAEMLPMIPDPYLRRRISVGKLEPTREGLPDFLRTYRAFDLVLGMRFHSNVCPIGMGVPARGLLCYPQVQHLYNELDMADRLVDVRHAGFRASLRDGVLTDLNDLVTLRQRCVTRMSQLKSQAQTTLGALQLWLKSNLD